MQFPSKTKKAPDLGRVPSFYAPPLRGDEIHFVDEIRFADEITFGDEIEESPSALTRWRLLCIERRTEIYKKHVILSGEGRGAAFVVEVLGSE